jgi:hypothetical protein
MFVGCSNMTRPDSWSASGACHPPCAKPPLCRTHRRRRDQWPGCRDARLGRLDSSALHTLSAAGGSSDSSGSQAAGTPSPSQLPANRPRTDCRPAPPAAPLLSLQDPLRPASRRALFGRFITSSVLLSPRVSTPDSAQVPHIHTGHAVPRTRASAAMSCDTRSHAVSSPSIGGSTRCRRRDSGQCPGPVPAPACVVSNDRVRSPGKSSRAPAPTGCYR